MNENRKTLFTPPRSITISGDVPLTLMSSTNLQKQITINEDFLCEQRLFIKKLREKIKQTKQQKKKWQNIISTKKSSLTIPNIILKQPKYHYELSDNVSIFYELRSDEDVLVFQHDNHEMKLFKDLSKKEKGLGEENMCCCCLKTNDELANETSLYLTLCNHHICALCSINLVKINSNDDLCVSCPVCRQKLLVRPVDVIIEY